MLSIAIEVRQGSRIVRAYGGGQDQWLMAVLRFPVFRVQSAVLRSPRRYRPRPTEESIVGRASVLSVVEYSTLMK